MDLGLKDKVALVTGGSRVIGAAIALELGRQGARVALTCSSRIESAQKVAAEIEKAGSRAMAVKADVTDFAKTRQTVEAVLRDFRKASPLVMRLNVRTLKRVRNMPFEQAHREAETVFLEELMATDDVLEGIASFYEKRKPEWKNS